MKVSAILNDKVSKEIATIGAGALIGQAVAEMAQKKIGALVVTGRGGGIEGILSERDVVRSLADDGPGVLGRTVGDLMTSPVETSFISETAHDVLTRMTQGRFRHMPVVDSAGRMTGFLSIGDVVKARLGEVEHENAAMAEMLSG